MQLGLETSDDRPAVLSDKSSTVVVISRQIPATPPESPSRGLNNSLSVVASRQNLSPLEKIRFNQEPHENGYYLIEPDHVALALEHHYTTKLPDVEETFPWMHGCNKQNVAQLAFLDPEKRFRDSKQKWVDLDKAVSSVHKDFTPPKTVRGLMVVKLGDPEDTMGSIIGTVRPDEVLESEDIDDELCDPIRSSYPSMLKNTFLNLDPSEGVSLRNFHVQVAKWATVSDIIVYAETSRDLGELPLLARNLVSAQIRHAAPSPSNYSVFVCSDPCVMNIFMSAPHCISTPPLSYFDAMGTRSRSIQDEWRLKNWGSDFLFHERVEMAMMSSASLLEDNVWLGNTVDFDNWADSLQELSGRDMSNKENVSEEAASLLEILNTPLHLKEKPRSLTEKNWATIVNCYEAGTQSRTFPSYMYLTEEIEKVQRKLARGDRVLEKALLISVPYGFSHEDHNSLVLLCKLVHLRSQMTFGDYPAGCLFFCADGYTESSVYALAYLMYSEGISAAQACINLHVKYKRSFFCFQPDITFLNDLEPLIWSMSPMIKGFQIPSSHEPWFQKMDGSLPSMILPHMYLGSLCHANNPEVLTRIGIKRILSVGEEPEWESPFPGETLFVDNVQDDGVDSLRDLLPKCLAFLNEGFHRQEPTLVHCRVGVSRSATVCIAEVMRRMNVGLPQAYLFVRVRRLNVIIQPNLRFMYELLKWEEQHRTGNDGWLREVDWHIFCREISMLNSYYIA